MQREQGARCPARPCCNSRRPFSFSRFCFQFGGRFRARFDREFGVGHFQSSPFSFARARKSSQPAHPPSAAVGARAGRRRGISPPGHVSCMYARARGRRRGPRGRCSQVSQCCLAHDMCFVTWSFCGCSWRLKLWRAAVPDLYVALLRHYVRARRAAAR